MTDQMCSVLESLLSVVYWFPFYYTFKFIFLLWLSLPVTRYVILHRHLLTPASSV